MARIPYDFTPFPRKLHPGWAGRSHASWGLCVRLWLLADGQPIQVHGPDWRASLCQQMGIGGRDRPTTRALMADLQSDGLMHVRDGYVVVQFHPTGPTGVSEESARGSTGVQPGVRQESNPSALSTQNHLDRILQTDRQTEETERERASAPAHASDFRIPVGEAPPNTPPREQPLGEWIAAEHAKRFVERTGASPGGANRYQTARDIGRWVEGNSEAYKLGNRALATKLLDGLFASERACSKRWPLSWILQDPTEFCGTPKVVAQPAAAAAPKSNNPTHQVWKAPDYEAEQRESEVAFRKRQEEWFREHPEYADAAAEADALIPKPRVVVSIVEAKPPKRPPPLNEQQRLERIRLLQEQAEKIRAASAAE